MYLCPQIYNYRPQSVEFIFCTQNANPRLCVDSLSNPAAHSYLQVYIQPHIRSLSHTHKDIPPGEKLCYASSDSSSSPPSSSSSCFLLTPRTSPSSPSASSSSSSSSSSPSSSSSAREGRIV
ncbi:hypothetical protein EGW08_023159 [Elysia chlorotica]|uniref:Uncharacterized protein n=1 Tax=Elysia chlorotica TaxID=188477 RepID=A0A3S1B0R3_ELYCH|nr:hypothetical protein EGW08_023159 [Elysia chlorotica]